MYGMEKKITKSTYDQVKSIGGAGGRAGTWLMRPRVGSKGRHQTLLQWLLNLEQINDEVGMVASVARAIAHSCTI